MSPRKLGELSRGTRGRIVCVGPDASACFRRCLEMGLLEGSDIHIVHEAPFGGDPIAVRVRGSLIALRRHEANGIQVLVDE